MTILIKNGTLITASETFEADILIEEEKICPNWQGSADTRTLILSTRRETHHARWD